MTDIGVSVFFAKKKWEDDLFHLPICIYSFMF